MQTISVPLSEMQFEYLNSRYPVGSKSAVVGARAIETLKIYFTSVDPSCTFAVPGTGCDIDVRTQSECHQIEVKGTTDSTIAWQKLKVSSQASHDALIAGRPMYRICGVNDRAPIIFVLLYPADFSMRPEPRWSVHGTRA